MSRQLVRPTAIGLPFTFADALITIANHNGLDSSTLNQMYQFGAKAEDPVEWFDKMYPSYGTTSRNKYIAAHEQLEKFLVQAAEIIRAKAAKKQEEEDRRKMFKGEVND